MSKVEEITLDISPLSQSPRRIFVYLPKNYDKLKKNYPVLYMFDGQNLFFDYEATYGKSWGLKDYLDKTNSQIIVVGIDCNHTGNNRLNEYSPYSFYNKNFGYIEGQGDLTLTWICEKLKSHIDKRYRTKPKREDTLIGGSSMGGLMSIYALIKRNDIFSKAIALSPSIKFVFKNIKKLLEETSLKPSKIYMDFGSKELYTKALMAKSINQLLVLNHLFLERNTRSYANLIIKGDHNEASWEKTIPTFMDFITK